MLLPYDPYIEQAALKISKIVAPDLKTGNNPIDKKGNKLFRSVLLFAFGAIITGIIINENFKQKQKMIELKRKREQEESEK